MLEEKELKKKGSIHTLDSVYMLEQENAIKAHFKLKITTLNPIRQPAIIIIPCLASVSAYSDCTFAGSLAPDHTAFHLSNKEPTLTFSFPCLHILSPSKSKSERAELMIEREIGSLYCLQYYIGRPPLSLSLSQTFNGEEINQ